MIDKFESFGSGKKMAIYHGYWSSIQDPDDIPTEAPAYDRLKVLKEVGVTANCDLIDYDSEWMLDKCQSMFHRELDKCKDVDVIMGFSLGGYTAYRLASYLSKDVILVNPALDRKITRLIIKEFDVPHKKNFSRIEVFFGDKDDLIPRGYTIRYLQSNGIDFDGYLVRGMGHNTPLPYFNQIIRSSNLLK